MEVDATDREASRKKAQEERAKVKEKIQRDREDDEILLSHGNERPKFAPPVKIKKQDTFGEKLKNSLGPFEIVAPLLQNYKIRSIYGVATCPETPSLTSPMDKPMFSLDIEPQPSTSNDLDPTKKNGFVQPRNRDKSNLEFVNGRQRSKSPSWDRNKRKVNDEWSSDRSAKNKSDRDRNGSGDYRNRRNDESNSNRKNDDKRQQNGDYHNHYHNNHHRNLSESSSKYDSESKRSSSNQSIERKRMDSEKSVSSLPSTSTTSSTFTHYQALKNTNSTSKLNSRHDRDQRNGYSTGTGTGPNPGNAEKKSGFERDGRLGTSSPVFDKKSKSPSASNSEVNKLKSKIGDQSPKTVHQQQKQRETGTSSTSTEFGKKQPALKLDGIATLKLSSKDGSLDEIPSTPAIEKMIKKVTGIVDAPPLSGIPTADPSNVPFTYPIKATEESTVTKTVTKKDSNFDKLDKRSRQEPVTKCFMKKDILDDNDATLNDQLQLSEESASDDSGEDSDDESDTETINTKNHSSNVEEHFGKFSSSPEKASSVRSDSQSPKKDEIKKERKEIKIEDDQSQMKNQSQFKYSLFDVLGEPASQSPADSVAAIPSTSSTAAATSRSSDHDRNPKKKRDKNETRKTCHDSDHSDNDRDRMDSSLNTDTGFRGKQPAATSEEAKSSEKALKMSLKLKNGKMHVVDPVDKVSDEKKAKRHQSPSLTRDDGGKAKKVKEDGAITNGNATTDEIENLKWSDDGVQFDSTSQLSKLNKLNGQNGKIFSSTDMILDPEMIFNETTRLSPLLSPIHDFPSLEFVNGKPSLLCQIPLNMLDRVPTKKSNSNLTQNGRQEINGTAATNSNSNSKTGTKGDENLYEKATESLKKPEKICKKSGKDASEKKDLDDVPILDRMNTDQKKRLSVGSGSSSTGGVQKEDEKEREKEKSKQTAINVAEKKPKVAKSTGNNRSIPSAPSKVQTVAKNQKSASKRKTIDEPPNDPGSPAKVPKLESSQVATDSFLDDAPTKPVNLELECEKEQQYQTKAKDVKHSADKSTTDKTLKILLYLESVVYFVMTGLCMEKILIKKNKESSTPHTMIKTTVELLKNVTQKYADQMALNPASSPGFVTKIDVISLRIQALCNQKMFEMRQTQALCNYRQLAEFQKANDRTSNSAPSSVTHPSSSGHSQGGPPSNGSGRTNVGGSDTGANSGVTPSPTPSPASSTGSSHSLPPGLVAIPQQIEMLYKQQLSHLHSLMWAHHYWQQAEQKLQAADKNDKAFFDHLNSICGTLALTSDLHDLCSYTLTAVNWLRQLYGKRNR